MKSKLISVALLSLLVFGSAFAADDPSIPLAEKTMVKSTVQMYINKNTENGTFALKDQETGEILRLALDKVHEGVAKVGNSYVTCVDMTSGADRYDVDFIVNKQNGSYTVTNTVIHAKNGQKRPNHLATLVNATGSEAKGMMQ